MTNFIALIDLIKDAFESKGFYSQELNKRAMVLKDIFKNNSTEQMQNLACEIDEKYSGFFMQSFEQQMYKNCVWLYLADVYIKNSTDEKDDIKRYIYAM